MSLPQDSAQFVLNHYGTSESSTASVELAVLGDVARGDPAARHLVHRVPRRSVEPPFDLESHRYQTAHAADWIAGLVRCLGARWKEPAAWPENAVFRRSFKSRLTRIQLGSGIRD